MEFYKVVVQLNFQKIHISDMYDFHIDFWQTQS